MNKTFEDFNPIFEYAKRKGSIIKEKNVLLGFETGICFPVKEYLFCLLWKYEDEDIIIEIRRSYENEEPRSFTEGIKEETSAKIYCIEKDWYDNKVVGGFLDFIEEKNLTLIDEILEKIKTNNFYFLNEATIKWFKQTVEIKIKERRDLSLVKIKPLFSLILSTFLASFISSLVTRFIV